METGGEWQGVQAPYKEIKAKRILSLTHKKPPGPYGPGGSLSYGKRKIICRFDTTQRYLR